MTEIDFYIFTASKNRHCTISFGNEVELYFSSFVPKETAAKIFVFVRNASKVGK